MQTVPVGTSDGILQFLLDALHLSQHVLPLRYGQVSKQVVLAVPK